MMRSVEAGESFGRRTLTAEREGDFFRWFYLAPAHPPWRERNGITHAFRPDGAKFRALAELVVVTNVRDEIDGCRLGLDRAFIDGPDGAFANDICKSFLLWAAGRDASAGLKAVAAWIGHPEMERSAVIMRAPVEPPPADRNGCAQVFFGRGIRARVSSSPIWFNFLANEGAMPEDLARFKEGLGTWLKPGVPGWLLIEAWPERATFWPEH